MSELHEKYARLLGDLRAMGSAAVAFSAGVDSTFLLKAAHEALGDGAFAVTVRSVFCPDREGDEAAAFCEKREDVLCSAAIALEYQKGNRDYIFTLVRGAPEYAPDVTEFMRRTLEEGGIPPRERAKQILLADELFALCCRCCKEEADVKVECAILPDENTIHLRMFAPMDGRDPLSAIETPAGESASNYIRTHTKRVAFEAGIERDMIEIISDLGIEKA